MSHSQNTQPLGQGNVNKKWLCFQRGMKAQKGVERRCAPDSESVSPPSGHCFSKEELDGKRDWGAGDLGLGTRATSLSPCSALLTDAGADSLPARGRPVGRPTRPPWSVLWLPPAHPRPWPGCTDQQRDERAGTWVCPTLKTLSSAWQCGGKPASLPFGTP